jgi:hypothetical protein
MQFSFDSYKKLIYLIKKNGYELANYEDYEDFERPCILRHDVDMNLQVAEKFAELEMHEMIKSTYYVLLTSDFYNVFSERNLKSISNILSMGHEIGIHFDEQRYKKQLEDCKDDDERIKEIEFAVKNEASILSEVIGYKIKTVSMHRPSKIVLNADMKFPELINSYGKKFCNEKFKYVSDSRMHWRENVEEIVSKKQFPALHILTHPIWYSNDDEGMVKRLHELFKINIYQTYKSLDNNFKNLDEVIVEEEILCKLQQF